MIPLTNTLFKKYFKTLSLTVECDKVVLQDECGEVVSYNGLNDTIIYQVAIIDGVEYKITDKQEDMLYKHVSQAYREEKQLYASAFTDNDYSHFSNLIHA